VELNQRLTKIVETLPKLLTLAAAILCPALTFAQDLQPTPTDMSIGFLSNIFGIVDGVLHGSGTQIFGAMFGVFNSAVLALGMTILGYTLFVATLKTAHEGEALGRDWNSMWVPLRSAAGFALMLPKASGYSIIQILTMWIVVQGVGAANLVWNAALDYLAQGGVVIRPQQPTNTDVVGAAGQVFQAAVCMSMIEQALRQEQVGQKNPVPVPSFADSVTNPTPRSQPEYSTNNWTGSISFPGKLYNADNTEYKNFYGACGKITWAINLQQGDNSALEAGAALATLQLITDLVPTAQVVAADYGPFPDAKKIALKNLSQGLLLVNAAIDYNGVAAAAENAGATGNEGSSFGKLTKFMTDAKQEGWLMAGTYYQQLVALNTNYVLISLPTPTVAFKYPLDDKTFPVPVAITADNAYLTPFFTEAGDNSLPQFSTAQYNIAVANAAAEQSTWVNTVLPFIQKGQGELQNQFKTIFGSVLGNIFSVVLPIGKLLQSYIVILSQTGVVSSSPISPVAAAAAVGSAMVNFVMHIWLVGAATVFGVSVLSGVCPAANPLPGAVNTAVAWFVPLLTAMMLLLFVMGATLLYYIPLIPYILFLFGGIGWIMGVIESMAAAPLVALGIAYPEEHQVLGKSQAAVMLLANIFVRPSLMVIGFIAGISLSYVAIWLLNRGFAQALTVLVTSTQGLAWALIPCAILSIYTVLVVEVLNRAFSLIHVLPDEVLRWVGGGHRQMGAEIGRAEEAVRGGAKGDIQQGGQAMAGGVGDAMKAKGAEEGKGGKLGAEEGGGGEGGGAAM
jgi:conjugal transfer/type IV secretion protein DotA/TraY